MEVKVRLRRSTHSWGLTKDKAGQAIRPKLPWSLCILATRKRVEKSASGTSVRNLWLGQVRRIEPREPSKTGGLCGRARGRISLEVESANTGAGTA